MPGAVAARTTTSTSAPRGAVRIRFGNSGDVFAAAYDNSYRVDGVTSAGDVNDDGVDDMIVGAPGESGDDGAAYVIYGGTLDAAERDVHGTSGAMASASPSRRPTTRPLRGTDAKDTTGYSVGCRR